MGLNVTTTLAPPPALEADAPEALAAPRLTRRQFLARNFALFAAAGLGDAVSETSNIQITRHRVPLPGLTTPTRIAQISDLHRSWCVSEDYIGRVVRQVGALKPDAIALTGDFVTRSSWYMPSCADALSHLRAPLGVYAVMGNHDYWCDQSQGLDNVLYYLRSIGAQVLRNGNTRLDSGLILAG